ncbi:MAG: ribonuclease III [Spirochaetes bacterium]|uniref:Ribonuclease 3 n=1 Tax=Candidatus Ornithospirochaeta stercoripullorum TaxID=2840899 RepID=A0A9D9H4F0_9SPIO|nr:ribonuclease III [Candidatus Ornithospirochaeta stercoripullorum]
MLKYLEKAPAISEERKGELFSFVESIGIHFNEYRLLNLAFTHTSYANECKGEVDNNERLEFLGDSVLGMVTAEYLFSSFTRFHEGQFSKIKAVVVSEESLSEVALSLHFDKYILVGRGERSQQGTMKKAILADALEAVIAAMYLDQGLETARRFILSFIPAQVEKMLENKLSYKDYKTELQEYLQKRRGKVPRYVIVSQTGPDHAQTFHVNVEMGTKVFGPGEGKNKKSAEQAAARMALIALGIERG